MIIGCPRETKADEYRVALTPAGAEALIREGHVVLVEAGAGEGSGFSDEQYGAAGAQVASAEDVWAGAELIVKVKEPQPGELRFLRTGQTLFAYLHLAAVPSLTTALLAAGATAIAYEGVALPDGSLPLLKPMSMIAGRLAPQVGARWLERLGPGRGKLLSGAEGSPPARVVILGAGTVSTNAATIAGGMGADVTMVARRPDDTRRIEARGPGSFRVVGFTTSGLEEALTGADLVISGVLVHGGHAAPKLLTRAHLAAMGAGAVVVDVSIDQGGVLETSRPTIHADPVYVEEGVVHYCVANMPGAVPRTSTAALTTATLPYVIEMARGGVDVALSADPGLAAGLMTRSGILVNEAVLGRSN